MKIQWTDNTSANHDIDEDFIDIREELDETSVECTIVPKGNFVQTISLLLDPEIPVLQILSFRVDLDSLDGVRCLYNISDGAGDLGAISLEHIRHFQVNGFTYFAAETDTPRMTLRIGTHECSEDDFYHVTIRFLVLDASYLASFRKVFLNQLKATESRCVALELEIREQIALENQLTSLQHELKVLKSSRIWRIAEKFRHLFYHKALSKFPRLREKILELSRRKVRRTFGDDDKQSIGALATNVIHRNARDEAYHSLLEHWEKQRPSDEKVTKKMATFQTKPLISLVMPVFNTPEHQLHNAVESVLAQRYDNFELCICNDASNLEETVRYLDGINHPRVRIEHLSTNEHISGATNHAISMARGAYIAFLDHDDLLDQDALFHVCETINEFDPDVIYTDEDLIDTNGIRCRPNFKPDFSPDLLLSHNYITHLLVVRADLLNACGVLDSTYDGAQDYDLVLRLSEMAARIVHIPKVLYHWRQSPGSSSLDPQSKPYVQERTRKLLHDTLQRRGIEADVLNANLPHFYYSRRRLSQMPPVSIIIPFKDEPVLLERCIKSILTKTTYTEYEIIGINNQSVSPITYELISAYQDNPRIRFIDYDDAFNFSAIVNLGAKKARGDYLVLLNNDIEIITWQWLEEMLCQALNENTGAVGGKLFYPDNTIQHAGIIVGINGYAGHGHKRFDCNAHGNGNRLQLVHNVSAVTGAFMMIKKELFFEVNGFDSKAFPVACNDVDFCLRLLDAGYWNVFTPYAQAYHLESASRGYEVTEEKRKRFEKEKEIFCDRHADIFEIGDPFYNPNLSLENESFMIHVPRGGAGPE